MNLSKLKIKVPESENEINICHKIREYVLKESFNDTGLEFNHYDPDHPAHNEPNISLICLLNNQIIGSVRMDKKFEHLIMKDDEIRLALFGISLEHQSKGYGTLFFEEIKKWCHKHSIKSILTNSRLKSHDFWLKNGFKDYIWDKSGVDDHEIQMIYRL